MTERFRDYDPFAWLYANYWGGSFHDQAPAVLDRLLLRKLPPPARILDLCCGDGRLTRVLDSRGYKMQGLDGSDEMLGHARKAAPHIPFHLGDARTFTLPGRFDAVISTFDSLNHVMTLRGLRQVFRSVFQILEVGGFFAFDLNREKAYTDLWTNMAGTVDTSAVSLARGDFNRRTGLAICDITLFRKQDGHWVRSDFTLKQKHHAHEDVMSALERTGFSPVASFDAQGDLGMRGAIGEQRTFYLARKPVGGNNRRL